MESTTQIFLRVQVSDDEDDFVRGESYVEGYADRVQIESFSFGLEKPTGPNAVKNMKLHPVEVSKVFDRASPRLAALLKSRTELAEVRITVDQQLEELGVGKAQNAVVVFHLLQARIIDLKLRVSEAGKSAAKVSESLTFSYRNFSVEYWYKGTKNNKKSDFRDQWVGFETEYEARD